MRETEKKLGCNYRLTITLSSDRYRDSVVSVQTNRHGIGSVTIGEYGFPICLYGQGESKARRRVASLATSFLNQIVSEEAHEMYVRFIRGQKRESQRARKRIKNAARRAHAPQRDTTRSHSPSCPWWI